MTSAESALPNAVVRIPLDQDGWNGLPKSRQALMQLDAAIGVTEICAIFYSTDAAGALRQMQSFARDVIQAVT